MITQEQSREIRRLASCWATARVRQAMVHNGYGGLAETPLGVTKKAEQTQQDLEDYLKTFTES